jgi:uncharacterized protein
VGYDFTVGVRPRQSESTSRGRRSRSTTHATPTLPHREKATTLKFHLATAAGNVVTGVGAGWLRVNADVHRQSLLLAPDAVVTPWALAGFAGLTEDDFAPLLDLRPAVVVFGSGATLRFAHPRLTRALVAARIGVETMDTAAACRTYNILAAEGRRVAAALIVEGTAAPASPAAR